MSLIITLDNILTKILKRGYTLPYLSHTDIALQKNPTIQTPRKLYNAGHAIRMAILIPILAALFKNFAKNQNPSDLNEDKILTIAIASACQNITRQGEGHNFWKMESAVETKKIFNELKIKNATQIITTRIAEILLHDAAVLDDLRFKRTLSIQSLALYKEALSDGLISKEKSKALETKLINLAKELDHLISKMGDLESQSKKQKENSLNSTLDTIKNPGDYPVLKEYFEIAEFFIFPEIPPLNYDNLSDLPPEHQAIKKLETNTLSENSDLSFEKINLTEKGDLHFFVTSKKFKTFPSLTELLLPSYSNLFEIEILGNVTFQFSVPKEKVISFLKKSNITPDEAALILGKLIKHHLEIKGSLYYDAGKFYLYDENDHTKTFSKSHELRMNELFKKHSLHALSNLYNDFILQPITPPSLQANAVQQEEKNLIQQFKESAENLNNILSSYENDIKEDANEIYLNTKKIDFDSITSTSTLKSKITLLDQTANLLSYTDFNVSEYEKAITSLKQNSSFFDTSTLITTAADSILNKVKTGAITFLASSITTFVPFKDNDDFYFLPSLVKNLIHSQQENEKGIAYYFRTHEDAEKFSNALKTSAYKIRDPLNFKNPIPVRQESSSYKVTISTAQVTYLKTPLNKLSLNDKLVLKTKTFPKEKIDDFPNPALKLLTEAQKKDEDAAAKEKDGDGNIARIIECLNALDAREILSSPGYHSEKNILDYLATEYPSFAKLALSLHTTELTPVEENTSSNSAESDLDENIKNNSNPESTPETSLKNSSTPPKQLISVLKNKFNCSVANLNEKIKILSKLTLNTTLSSIRDSARTIQENIVKGAISSTAEYTVLENILSLLDQTANLLSYTDFNLVEYERALNALRKASPPSNTFPLSLWSSKSISNIIVETAFILEKVKYGEVAYIASDIKTFILADDDKTLSHLPNSIKKLIAHKKIEEEGEENSLYYFKRKEDAEKFSITLKNSVYQLRNPRDANNSIQVEEEDSDDTTLYKISISYAQSEYLIKPLDALSLIEKLTPKTKIDLEKEKNSIPSLTNLLSSSNLEENSQKILHGHGAWQVLSSSNQHSHTKIELYIKKEFPILASTAETLKTVKGEKRSEPKIPHCSRRKNGVATNRNSLLNNSTQPRTTSSINGDMNHSVSNGKLEI